LSDNNKNEDKSDLTRIEDLSEYLHDEDEDMDGLESFEGADDFDLMDAKTDPNIELPPEFTQNFSTDSFEEETDFEAMENEQLPEIPEDEDTNFDTSSEFDSGEEDNGEDSDFTSSFEEPSDDDGLSQESFDDDTDFDNSSFSNDDFNNDEDEDFASFEDANEESLDDLDSLQQETVTAELFDNFEDEPKEELPPAAPVDEKSDDFESIEPKEEIKVEDVPSSIADGLTEKSEPRSFLKEEPKSAPPAQEDLQELAQFAKNISYGNLATEGNPPFSIVLKDVKYKEDIDDIVQLLKEFQIIKDEQDEKRTIESLNRSSLLIPRLGEYSAILICHKLRKYDINILMGLTEEINPPKDYESEDRGIVSKHSVYNSRSHHYNLKKEQTSSEEIMVSTTPYFEGHDILEYLGIVSESAIIDSETLISSGKLEEQLIERLPEFQQDRQRIAQVERENLLASNSLPPEDILAHSPTSESKKSISVNDIQKELVGKLKHQAVSLKGNAIVGVTLHVTPIGSTQNSNGRDQYQLTCSGSVVWINKR
tara:strand:+ start:231548 stop:233161 length:1614 start_codon:yes stop_codon:yes gene_type:complete